MEEILGVFIQEAREQLTEMENGLMRMEQGDHDPETLNGVFRAAHTIKGGSGVVELTMIEKFTHVVENALDKLRNNEIDDNEIEIEMTPAANAGGFEIPGMPNGGIGMINLSDMFKQAMGGRGVKRKIKVKDAYEPLIAEEAGLDLSSATIRSILSELEQEGYLVQPHTSAGRVPTDRGYRFFVDYLENVQRLASGEKEQIEKQYCNRLEELDRVLAHTSRLLSTVSHSAGLVLSPRSEAQGLKRLELIGLGGNRVLAIIVTKAGQVRHWPLQLSFVPNEARLRALNRFLNEHLEGKSIREVRSLLAEQLEQAEREMAPYRDRLAPEAWQRAVTVTVDRGVRAHLGLPALEW